jgi:hypothetical protein
MAKQINCGICAYWGNTVAMNLAGDHFTCPECKAELHVNSTGDDTFVRNFRRGVVVKGERDEISELMADRAITHVPRVGMPAGEALLGGGSKSKAGKSEKMKKKTLSQINQGLNGKCSSFDS